MNTFSVEYFKKIPAGYEWANIPGKFMMPLNFAKLLDERLDECTLFCYNDVNEHYAPNTIFRVRAYTDNVQVFEMLFKVAEDTSVEYPSGSSLYKHTIQLVETTKYLEQVVCQTLTFTNQLLRTFDQVARPIHLTGTVEGIDISSVAINNLTAPKKSGSTFVIPSPRSVGQYLADYMTEQAAGTYNCGVTAEYPTVGGGYATFYTDCEVTIDGETQTIADNETLTVTANEEISLSYRFAITRTAPSLNYAIQSSATGAVGLIKEIKPSKKWTIATVCERIFDLAEPLFGSEAPRFYLDTDQRAELDKIISPEFSMAQSTLREQLRVVGGYIHAEPRITAIYAAGHRLSYDVKFDYYGKFSAATLPSTYLRKQYQTTLANYCTRVHTNAANMVNSLAKAASVSDPGNGIYKSLRTEQINVRADETNGVLQTQFPIYSVEKLLCGIFKISGNTVTQLVEPKNITGYLFEATEYDNLLTSFNGAYPNSKAYGIRYQQGEKNITQLFYECPNVISQSFESYAIVNILAEVTGLSKTQIEGYREQDGASIVFQLVYKPIFSTAYTHGKQLYDPTEEPVTMIYNQSNGLIESEYYGENIKGVAARLGNVEFSASYIFPTFSDIPSVGDCVGDYYISAVSVEMDSFNIRGNIAFTKDFNRISQYIGINSEKRISEISVKQPYERDIAITEHLVVSESEPVFYYGERTIGEAKVLESFRDIFAPATDTVLPVTQGFFIRHNTEAEETEEIEMLDPVILPAVCCAQGNKVIMTCSFKDNYAAGTAVEYLGSGNTLMLSEGEIKGFWGRDVKFCDDLGRARYMSFAFDRTFGTSDKFAFSQPSAEDVPYVPSFTHATVHTQSPYLVRKDNRERLATVSYSVECVTDNKSLNIGSGLAKRSRLCWLRSLNEERPHIYGIVGEMPYKFDTDIIDYDRSAWVDLGVISATFVSEGDHGYVELVKDTGASAQSFVGWVIAMPVTSSTETVLNEEGEEEQQTTYSGGEILISKQGTFTRTKIHLYMHIVK